MKKKRRSTERKTESKALPTEGEKGVPVSAPACIPRADPTTLGRIRKGAAAPPNLREARRESRSRGPDFGGAGALAKQVLLVGRAERVKLSLGRKRGRLMGDVVLIEDSERVHCRKGWERKTYERE